LSEKSWGGLFPRGDLWASPPEQPGKAGPLYSSDTLLDAARRISNAPVGHQSPASDSDPGIPPTLWEGVRPDAVDTGIERRDGVVDDVAGGGGDGGDELGVQVAVGDHNRVTGLSGVDI
jgi:hypothetical protein